MCSPALRRSWPRLVTDLSNRITAVMKCKVGSGSEKSLRAAGRRGKGSHKQLSMVWEEEKSVFLGQHHVGALWQVGQGQAIWRDISRPCYSCCFLTHYLQEMRQDYIMRREDAVSATNTLSFVAEACRGNHCSEELWEQLSPEISQLPKLDFAACFSVNRVWETALWFVVQEEKVC